MFIEEKLNVNFNANKTNSYRNLVELYNTGVFGDKVVNCLNNLIGIFHLPEFEQFLNYINLSHHTTQTKKDKQKQQIQQTPQQGQSGIENNLYTAQNIILKVDINDCIEYKKAATSQLLVSYFVSVYKIKCSIYSEKGDKNIFNSGNIQDIPQNMLYLITNGIVKLWFPKYKSMNETVFTSLCNKIDNILQIFS